VAVAYVAGLVLLLVVLPRQTILTPDNGTRLGVPGLKVPAEYEVARFIATEYPNRPTVLSPTEISTWLPTVHHHPYPVLARPHSVSPFGEEGLRRLGLKTYVAGERRHEGSADTLRRGLGRYDVGVVCLPESNPWRSEIEKLLQLEGYGRGPEVDGYLLWVRE
jgi:hypothetical protein